MSNQAIMLCLPFRSLLRSSQFSTWPSRFLPLPRLKLSWQVACVHKSGLFIAFGGKGVEVEGADWTWTFMPSQSGQDSHSKPHSHNPVLLPVNSWILFQKTPSHGLSCLTQKSSKWKNVGLIPETSVKEVAPAALCPSPVMFQELLNPLRFTLGARRYTNSLWTTSSLGWCPESTKIPQTLRSKIPCLPQPHGLHSAEGESLHISSPRDSFPGCIYKPSQGLCLPQLHSTALSKCRYQN